MRPGRGWTALVLLGAVGLSPGDLRAQDEPRRCRVEDSRVVRSISAGEGRRITYVSEPRIRCVDGTRLEADSAVVFEATGLTQLVGRVFFDDPDTRLTADRANYFENQRRLRAWGRTVLTDRRNRSVIRGDTLVLLRAGPARLVDELTVTGERPHATLYPEGAALPEVESPQADPAGAPPRPAVDAGPVGEDPDPPRPGAEDEPHEGGPGAPPDEGEPDAEPYEVDADRFYFRGQEYMLATGNVIVVRGDSLDASADTLVFMRDRDLLELRGAARIRSAMYDIEGRTVALHLPDDEIREITAREDAVLVGEELRLDAETIRIFMEAGAVERLVASADPEREGDPAPDGAAPPRRPVAVAEAYRLVADSLDVLAPGGELERLVAIGSARGEGIARDSLNTPDTPGVLRNDWVEGDTVIALFSRVPPAPVGAAGAPDGGPLDPEEPDAPAAPDTATDGAASEDPAADDYRLDELRALGNARSLYRIEPSDTSFVAGRDRPAASYVVGQSIRILLEEGSVTALEVEGLSRGVHLEPRDPARPPADAGPGADDGVRTSGEVLPGRREP